MAKLHYIIVTEYSQNYMDPGINIYPTKKIALAQLENMSNQSNLPKFLVSINIPPVAKRKYSSRFPELGINKNKNKTKKVNENIGN